MMNLTLKESDVVTLKDGRKAIIHSVYDNGRAYLVEIINFAPQKAELPIVKCEDIDFSSISVA